MVGDLDAILEILLEGLRASREADAEAYERYFVPQPTLKAHQEQQAVLQQYRTILEDNITACRELKTSASRVGANREMLDELADHITYHERTLAEVVRRTRVH